MEANMGQPGTHTGRKERLVVSYWFYVGGVYIMSRLLPPLQTYVRTHITYTHMHAHTHTHTHARIHTGSSLDRGRSSHHHLPDLGC